MQRSVLCDITTRFQTCIIHSSSVCQTDSIIVRPHQLSILLSLLYRHPYLVSATLWVHLVLKISPCHRRILAWWHGTLPIKDWVICNILGECLTLCSCVTCNSLIILLLNSGIPHLAVSNSTPPPSSSSPAPVKIKSEPISPPRDQLLSQQQQQSIVTSMGGSSTISVLNHSSLGNNLNHQHLISSRPSSTGHLTPTPGEYSIHRWSLRDDNNISPVIFVEGSSGDPSSPGDMRHTNQSITMSSHLPDYESSNSSHPKRPRISEGWAT